MRPIENMSVREKRESRNKMIFSLLVVGLLLLSIAGYAFFSSDEKKAEKPLIYNGFEFFEGGQYWNVNIKGQEYYFQYLPNETKEIEVNFQSNLDNFKNRPLYFSSDMPGSNEILINIGKNIERSQLACLDKKNCEEDLPVKDCSNNFIIFQVKNISKIIQEGNCIYILVSEEDQIKASDAFLYRILGIT